MIIANLTTQQFFKCENDSQRDKYLKDLITPLTFNKEHPSSFGVGGSHWMRSDRIVFVKDRLEKYVMTEYGELFMN